MLSGEYITEISEELLGLESAPLLVLGKNSSEPHEPWLSAHSVENTLAAVELARLGLAPVIIFSSGDTNGYGTSEAEWMAELFIRYADVIPPGIRKNLLLIIEPRSRETGENAYCNNQIAKLFGFEGANLLTVRNHMPRAEMLHRAYELPIWGTITAETVLRYRDRDKWFGRTDPKTQAWNSFRNAIGMLAEIYPNRMDKIKEKLYYLEEYVDVTANLAWLITRLTRRPGRRLKKGTSGHSFFPGNAQISFHELYLTSEAQADIRVKMAERGKDYAGPFIITDPLGVNADTQFCLLPGRPQIRVRPNETSGKTLLKVSGVASDGEIIHVLYNYLIKSPVQEIITY